MSGVSSTLFDLLTYEIVNKIVNEKWDQKSYKEYNELCAKLDAIGVKTGSSWAELKTLSNPNWDTPKNTIEYIAKYFWLEIFGKNADEIIIDNQGSTTIVDKDFRPTKPISSPNSNDKILTVYTIFYNGIIKGILNCAGYNASVTNTIDDKNECSFTITIY
ncbi:hypothetical protein WA158_004096 [Blastocystis sp. Blastoise]